MRNTNVGDLLRRIDGLGVILDAPTEDRLRYHPKVALAKLPELVEELRENKAAIIRILRENAEMRRIGIVRVERRVFDREYFGLDEKGGAA